MPFKLLIDTFHHHLYPQAADEFSRVEVADIGLVHLSGVDDSRPREQLTDAERIMLTPQDRLGTCEQVKALEARGYQGCTLFEPFAPSWRNGAKRISSAKLSRASRSSSATAPETLTVQRARRVTIFPTPDDEVAYNRRRINGGIDHELTLLIARTLDNALYLLPAMANRHGLITGATGTGKTVTLQKLAESFSEIGVPVFMADVKGDLTGIAAAGQSSEKLQARLEDRRQRLGAARQPGGALGYLWRRATRCGRRSPISAPAARAPAQSQRGAERRTEHYFPHRGRPRPAAARLQRPPRNHSVYRR